MKTKYEIKNNSILVFDIENVNINNIYQILDYLEYIPEKIFIVTKMKLSPKQEQFIENLDLNKVKIVKSKKEADFLIKYILKINSNIVNEFSVVSNDSDFVPSIKILLSKNKKVHLFLRDNSKKAMVMKLNIMNDNLNIKVLKNPNKNKNLKKSVQNNSEPIVIYNKKNKIKNYLKLILNEKKDIYDESNITIKEYKTKQEKPLETLENCLLKERKRIEYRYELSNVKGKCYCCEKEVYFTNKIKEMKTKEEKICLDCEKLFTLEIDELREKYGKEFLKTTTHSEKIKEFSEKYKKGLINKELSSQINLIERDMSNFRIPRKFIV